MFLKKKKKREKFHNKRRFLHTASLLSELLDWPKSSFRFSEQTFWSTQYFEEPEKKRFLQISN